MAELAREVKNIPIKGKPVFLSVLSALAFVGGVVAPVAGLGDNLAFYLLGISLVLAVSHVGNLIVWHKES